VLQPEAAFGDHLPIRPMGCPRMASEVVTQIVINAPAPRVWAHLVDFARYPEWNPVVRGIEGVAETGARLRVHLHLPGTRRLIFNPLIERLHVGRELVSVSHTISPSLFTGVHSFIVEPLADDKTHFVQRQFFSGILVPLLWPMLRTRTRRGFLLMNSALKGAVERN
jgi:hypothetical protein